MQDLPYKKFLSIIIPYCFGITTLYLFGYWSEFGINIFALINISEVIKYSLYSLMGSLSFTLLFVVFSLSTTFAIAAPGSGENTKIGKFGRKHWRELIVFSLFLIIIVVKFVPNPLKWFIIATIVAMYSAPLSHLKIVIELLPNPYIRAIVLSLWLYLVGMSLACGKYEAYSIKNGYGYTVVDIERSKLTLQADEKHPVAYLGHVSGYLALYESKSGSVVLMKFKGDEQIFFINNPKNK